MGEIVGHFQSVKIVDYICCLNSTELYFIHQTIIHKWVYNSVVWVTQSYVTSATTWEHFYHPWKEILNPLAVTPHFLPTSYRLPLTNLHSVSRDWSVPDIPSKGNQTIHFLLCWLLSLSLIFWRFIHLHCSMCQLLYSFFMAEYYCVTHTAHFLYALICW